MLASCRGLFNVRILGNYRSVVRLSDCPFSSLLCWILSSKKANWYK